MSEPPVKLVYSRERSFESVAFEDIKPSVAASLIKGVLPARGLGYLLGASRAGKTFVGLDVSLRLAAGAPTIMGRRAKQTGVVYIAAEDPDGCAIRVEAWKRKNPRGSYTPFRLIPRGVNLLDEDQVDQLMAELRDIASIYESNDQRLGLIVFDTWSKCLPGGEENGSADGSRAVAAIERIGRDLEAFTLALAHHGKTEGRGVRGWSGFDAASDATVTVERDEETGDRCLTLTKVKNGVDGDKIAFVLERQPLGLFDEDGDELWSCTVRYEEAAPDAAPKKRRKALSTNAELVLRALAQLLDKEIRQAVPAVAEGVRQGTWAVRRQDLSAEAADLGLMYEGEKMNTYHARFGRALSELVVAKRVRRLGDAIWAP